MPVLIHEIVSDDAELRLLPKSADKDPAHIRDSPFGHAFGWA